MYRCHEQKQRRLEAEQSRNNSARHLAPFEVVARPLGTAKSPVFGHFSIDGCLGFEAATRQISKCSHPLFESAYLTLRSTPKHLLKGSVLSILDSADFQQKYSKSTPCTPIAKTFKKKTREALGVKIVKVFSGAPCQFP